MPQVKNQLPLLEPLVVAHGNENDTSTATSRTGTGTGTGTAAENDAPTIGKLKHSCLVLGILIGFFIQVSTIGASFLTNLPWAKGASEENIALYALAWSVITATASCGVMVIFRSFVEITFNLTVGRALSCDPVTHDRLLGDFIWYFEC